MASTLIVRAEDSGAAAWLSNDRHMDRCDGGRSKFPDSEFYSSSGVIIVELPSCIVRENAFMNQRLVTVGGTCF